LKNGIKILSRPLIKIFTACLVLGYIAETRQKVSVIFIPKPGRTSNELAESFRPIILLSFLLKTMERLVDQSIRMGPLKRFPLEWSQHAYRRGRSSETALLDLKPQCRMDVEGAFDNTSFEAMGKACADHETKSCVILDIHFGGETNFDLCCLIVVEKSVTN
jgi:hypothetical protein